MCVYKQEVRLGTVKWRSLAGSFCLLPGGFSSRPASLDSPLPPPAITVVSRDPSFSIRPGAGPAQGGLRSVRGEGRSVQYGVGLRPSFTLEAGTSHTLEAYSIYHGNSPGS